ncbi:hypothetical protein K458DRAFT_417330 [Lentithecium fluviatile CBS 122367]|uniref:Uncharacterized protein n=1 Tax=Lentithecium fluviatile CBS 122367 TaxID=1168545 RepID=A0A6G1J4Y2_9PLEO|nr:hypothetical protein K458DRAFT_417330 [Lentithecium fluviatile CBS 122367]
MHRQRHETSQGIQTSPSTLRTLSNIHHRYWYPTAQPPSIPPTSTIHPRPHQGPSSGNFPPSHAHAHRPHTHTACATHPSSHHPYQQSSVTPVKFFRSAKPRRTYST